MRLTWFADFGPRPPKPASRSRTLSGAALFTQGFRPFFLFGAVQAAVMIALWVPVYLGWLALPVGLPATAWHAHELLFGYAGAVIAGFLLTAVPNWTGRLPLSGRPLMALFGLWLIGRAAMAAAGALPPVLLALLTLAMPVALLLAVTREIVIGGNWRNLKVVGILTALIGTQILFHVNLGREAVTLPAERLALAVIVLLIMVIGGRIIPSFTTNWLNRENPGALPAPFDRFDRAALIVGVLALIVWASNIQVPVLPALPAALLIAAAALQAARLARWQGRRCWREPLVGVLHVAYGFIPLGFLLAGLGVWRADAAIATAAIHGWSVGAIGLMTLAVMTRATRGHTGRPLTAPPSTVAIYALAITAAIARIAAALWPSLAIAGLVVAGTAWVGAFALFAGLYGPLLINPLTRQKP